MPPWCRAAKATADCCRAIRPTADNRRRLGASCAAWVRASISSGRNARLLVHEASRPDSCGTLRSCAASCFAPLARRDRPAKPDFWRSRHRSFRRRQSRGSAGSPAAGAPVIDRRRRRGAGRGLPSMPRMILVSIGTSSSSPARGRRAGRQQRSAEQAAQARARSRRRLNLAAKPVARRIGHPIPVQRPCKFQGDTRVPALTIGRGSGRFCGALPDQGFIQQAHHPGNDGDIG